MDLREIIDKAIDCKPIPLVMPEWGNAVVWIKKWSWDEQRRIDRMSVIINDPKTKELQDKIKAIEDAGKEFIPTPEELADYQAITSFMPTLAQLSLCRENGERLYGDGDEELAKIKAKSPAAIDRIVDAAFNHNNSGDDVESLKKSSGLGPTSVPNFAAPRVLASPSPNLNTL